ncbi:gamma-glutamyltransferase [Alteromonas sp. SM 2104]|nr:gamma-glutamyltransferase [Alteromonas oceanisediminis]
MPDSFSADAALAVLNEGGNAVDAAIAAQFVLAVTYPEAGNIGGGGFMLIHKDGQQHFLDYREMAPGRAHRDMYLDENGDVIPYASLFGTLAAGIPGTVEGMWQAHQRHGTLPWARLVQPAVMLAAEGFVVPEKLAGRISRYIERIEARDIDVNFAEFFADAKAGETFVQTELAVTLMRIRDKGADGFYRGTTASIISEFMADNGGLINEDDLAAYTAQWRQPITAQWRDYTVVTSPPTSSGGIAILQWLGMYDRVEQRLGVEMKHNSVDYMHVLAEVGKRVFADRGEYLGDPDFVDVPTGDLLNDDYLDQRAAPIQLGKLSLTESVKPGLKESEDTTHFSIVDSMGNAVSNTTTINLSFGSGVVVEGAGFILNDEMDDFSAKEGVPNFFGAIGGKANAIAPYKRMLSSMSPTIVLQEGRVKMVTGSPGGTTILTSVYQSILNALVFNMPVEAVVNTPRFHHQLLPEHLIRHHPGIDASTLNALVDMGYNLRESEFGDLHVILKTEQGLTAASEARGRGKAVVEVTE